MAAALKRAVRLGEPSAAPRVSDLGAVVASTAGKIELETLGDETREDRVIEKLVARAVVNVFNRHFAVSRAGRPARALRGGRGGRGGRAASPSAAHERLVDDCRSCAARSAGWRWASRRPAWRAGSSSCWRVCTSTAA